MEDPGVVVIAGPPGAGKSTVARLVAAQFDPSVCLESDWFWTTIANGFIAPWEPASDDQNRAVLRATVAAVSEFALAGYPVVLDGVVGPWNLGVVTDAMAAIRIPVTYVVLRPDLATCLARAAGRAGEAPRIAGNPPLTDEGPIRALWQQFSDLGDLEHHAIDTTGMEAPAAAAAVLTAISTRTHRC